MGDDGVDHPHRRRLLRRVVEPEEEDLPGDLLPDLAREQRRAIPAVEARDVGVRLLEHRVLAARQRQVADHVEAVAAARRPAGHHRDDDLGHEPDEPLHLQDVEPAEPRRVGLPRALTLVFVPVLPADALIAAGAERPAAVLRRRPVAGDQHAADVRGRARVLERGVQLVDGAGTKRVADLGTVERDADGALVHGAVVGEILEREPIDLAPARRVENRRDGHGPLLCGADRTRLIVGWQPRRHDGGDLRARASPGPGVPSGAAGPARPLAASRYP